MFETTASGPLNLAASPLTNQTVPCGYQQINSLSSTPPHPNHDQSSFLNLLQLSQERNTNPITDVSSKADDEYGFLWEDMNLEETILGDGVASNLENMRFGVDNSMIFL